MAQPTKVFVGSLPQGTKPEELRRLFENYGVVVECDVMNRCGFVHMKNVAMAESAIEALHETEFKGQNIVVEFGRPKERKQGGGGGGNPGVGRGPRGGGVNRGIMVGFPGKQNSNKFNSAATLQLAGVIMELLGDQQNQLDDISGGNNNMRGGDSGFRRGGGGHQGGGGRGGGFHGNRGGNQNMNGVGPMRNQGFKNDRSTPYHQGMNIGGPPNNQTAGGRFSNQSNRGGVVGGPVGGYNNTRGGNFAPKPTSNNYSSGNNSWNNNPRSSIPQQNVSNFAEDNFSSGFSGNMGNTNGGNFGGQQDRRGFALPSNQFQQYGAAGSNQMGGFGSNDGTAYGDDAIFQRRNNSASNAPVIIDFRSAQGSGSMGGGGNFNRGGNTGGRGGGGQPGFQNNRSAQGFQQVGQFKRAGPGGNNMNSGDNYQQNFPLLGDNGVGGQGGFGGGQGSRGRGGGGGMNRNTPRQNMPNRRY